MVTAKRDIILVKPDCPEVGMLNRLLHTSAEGGDVIPIDQTPVYELGRALSVLKDVIERENSSAIEQVLALYGAVARLDELSSGVPFDVSYCADSLKGLIRECKSAISYYESDEKLFDGNKPALAPWQLANLKSCLDIFEHQFVGEIKKKSTYIVPDRGIFQTEGLVDFADNHIHSSIRNLVPPVIRLELRASGRCLAFGLFSASGFHAARAVEGVLRDYYAAFLGEPGETPMGLMAGHLNDLLKSTDSLKKKPKENTVRHLRDVATFDRNPLIHKGVDLDELDAMTFFQGSMGVIIEMVKELSSPEIQQTLPLLSAAVSKKEKLKAAK